MWLSIALLVVIILLLVWIYYSGGGTPRTRELTQKIQELEEENESLRETNETLRGGLDSTAEKFSHSVSKVNDLVEELVRVRDALNGSKKAKEMLKEDYGEEAGRNLVKKILSSEETINSPLKRRIAHEIFVGDIGREILKGLRGGRSLNNIVADAGVPLKIGKSRLRLLEETGYVNSKLNLTDWGAEALEL